jgi:hypothetical protein
LEYPIDLFSFTGTVITPETQTPTPKKYIKSHGDASIIDYFQAAATNSSSPKDKEKCMSDPTPTILFIWAQFD